ncbi:gamma-glutamyl-gamma-aminobutyrate hydrolase family protein [Balneola sp. MJW-20]|uniref:gamma-glutamyl-gamma-aminobutyrate hydrolase family protein n=1 Tax=Gracilimonas aurantiaca TaxID=3234185 RepID=UPI003908DC57
MLPKPVIGVTGPSKGGTAAWLATALSIILAGGHPLRITTSKKVEISEIDGLIIGGGADIDPGRYGERFLQVKKKAPGRSIMRWVLNILLFPVYWLIRKLFQTKSPALDTERDELELKLINEAILASKPVMGICRGMQLLNVHYGGTLHQDISNFYVEQSIPSSIFPLKQVEIKPDTLLRSILGKEVCIVNALHHQAIKKLGEGMKTAACEMGKEITQSIQHTGENFVIGVQWHPEYMIQVPEQRRLFQELVRRSAADSA